MFVQFELGTKVKTFEVSPAGRNLWEDHSSRLILDICPNTREPNEKNPSFRVKIYDDSYLFDFRVNGSVVWKNIVVADRRLIIIGYNGAPFVVGSVDYFWNSLSNC